MSLLLFSRYIGFKGAKIISINSLIFNVIISGFILIDNIKSSLISKITIGNWLNIGLLYNNYEIIFDKQNIIMINLISIITLIVVYYSFWYLDGDPHITRFISYLLLFSFTMYLLVLSNNFILMFGGWETVGIMSYLLINYWSTSLNSNKSSFKAILFNKVGDISYLFALILLFFLYSNFNIYNLPLFNNNSFIIYGFLLAAIAKSAQFFLHCWLGDAMAGPTPVSALLHAATMVTAGIFLILRINSYIYTSDFNTYFLLIIGALTIIFAGFSSIYQYDIKRIIAFSTCSQIGYMFINNGLIASTDIGNSSLFHLFTHGFFKALLFLCAGILIHNSPHPHSQSMGGFNEQDIRKYGGLLYKFPISYIFVLIGTLSIISFPFLSGFFSKEAILFNSFLSVSQPYNTSFFLFILLFGALLTTIYSFKLFFNSFFGYNNSPNFTLISSYSYEIPKSLFFFLIPLIFGSIFIGYYSNEYFLGLGINNFSILHSFLPTFLHYLPLITILIGFFFSFSELPFYYSYYFASLFNRRLFFDSLYNYLLAYPFLSLGYNLSFKFFDRGFLEFFGPLGFFRFFYFFPNLFSLQNQSLLNYSFLFFYIFFSFFFFSLFLFLI